VNVRSRHKIPSSDECYALLGTYHVPDHIIQHSEVVCTVAVFLAEHLNEKGQNLNIPEIRAAALLHDLTKMEGLEERRDHAKTGNEALKKLGFERIGEIVAEHIRLEEKTGLKVLSEEEILNYSDKRVMHTSVVSLADRFVDLKERYGANGLDENAMERIARLEAKTHELENRIFATLDFTPDELPLLLQHGGRKDSQQKG
jgi:uncharacterized protein